MREGFMDRRHFLRFSGALCAAQAALPLAARAEQAPVSADWRGFELTTHIQVLDPGAHPRLWIPLPYAADTTYQRGAQAPGWSAAAAARSWRRPPATTCACWRCNGPTPRRRARSP
ncbi:hypothetical protein WJ972_26815 [Achromobacter insuavis]